MRAPCLSASSMVSVAFIIFAFVYMCMCLCVSVCVCVRLCRSCIALCSVGVMYPAVKPVDNWHHGQTLSSLELTRELQQSERERERDRGTECNLMTERLSTYIIQEQGGYLFIYESMSGDMNMVMCVVCVCVWE